MTRTAVSSDQADALGPYSQSIVAGGLAFYARPMPDLASGPRRQVTRRSLAAG
jgi:hypothetical protein